MSVSNKRIASNQSQPAGHHIVSSVSIDMENPANGCQSRVRANRGHSFGHVFHSLLLAFGCMLLTACGAIRDWSPTSPYRPAAPPTVPHYDAAGTSYFKPVSQPGTQRRVAQQEAENIARRHLFEHIGELPCGPGSSRTVNQAISNDARLRAKVLEYVRTQPVLDWGVDPCAGTVIVIVRGDLQRLAQVLAEPNC